jgi:hypothetical protein
LIRPAAGRSCIPSATGTEEETPGRIVFHELGVVANQVKRTEALRLCGRLGISGCLCPSDSGRAHAFDDVSADNRLTRTNQGMEQFRTPTDDIQGPK